MAVSGLAIPPDQNLSHRESILDRSVGVSIARPPVSRPSARRDPCPAARSSLVAELAQHQADHVAAHAGTVGLDIGDGERPHAALTASPTCWVLAPRPGQGPDSLLELPVGAEEHAPEVVEPGKGVVAALVPALGARLEAS